jgi:hypothetical protein
MKSQELLKKTPIEFSNKKESANNLSQTKELQSKAFDVEQLCVEQSQQA